MPRCAPIISELINSTKLKARATRMPANKSGRAAGMMICHSVSTVFAPRLRADQISVFSAPYAPL